MEVHVLGSGDEDLLIRAVQMSDGLELTRDRATAQLSERSLIAVAAVEEGEVIGFSYAYMLPRFQRTELLIYSIEVEEGHRRFGVGRALIERFKALCADRGWAAMWVFTNESNAAAMALYRSAGGVRPNPDDAMFDFRA